jgi:hypothetical protein
VPRTETFVDPRPYAVEIDRREQFRDGERLPILLFDFRDRHDLTGQVASHRTFAFRGGTVAHADDVVGAGGCQEREFEALLKSEDDR